MIALFQGHSSYITHIDWSEDGEVLRSNSGDYECLFCKYISIFKHSDHHKSACLKIIFLFLNKIYVVGTQKNRLNETVPLSTPNAYLD